MYERVTKEELLQAIDRGWYPTWFAIENSVLSVDMCVNFRLTDGKVLFLQFYSTDSEELGRVAREVAKKTKEAWVATIDKMASQIDEQVQDVAEAQKNIASVKWVEGQKYTFTYDDGDKVNYECTVADDEDIYLKKILKEDESYLRLLISEKSVREVVHGDTKIEVMVE